MKTRIVSLFLAVCLLAALLPSFPVAAKDARDLSFTVTYDANGGENAPEPQAGTVGTPLLLSAVVPTRTGYVFQGWAMTPTATVPDCQPGSTYAGSTDLALYAVWGLGPYTVSFDANGGVDAPAPVTKAHDTALTLPLEMPSRSGYAFVGWATSATATEPDYLPGGTYAANDSATLFAVWAASAYTVTYHANGGSNAPAIQEKAQNIDLTLSGTVPTRANYDFLGWATSAAATEPEYQPGDTYSKNENVSLYAVWTIHTYKVTYDANGGETAPDAQKKAHGAILTLTSNLPTRTGYTFLGWALLPESTSPDYQPGDTYTDDADVTLYAIWQILTYTITYDTDGGMPVPAAQAKEYGATLILTDQIPAKNHYTFLGWAETSGATAPTYLPGGAYTANADLTLYAVWDPETYPVTFVRSTRKDTVPAPQKKRYGLPLTLTTEQAVRIGYTFLGWAETPGAAAPAYQPGDVYTADAPLTLYPLWQARQYTTNFDPNGGTFQTAAGSPLTPSALTVTFDAAYGTLPTPVRDGYTFEGWFTGVDSGQQATSGALVAVDLPKDVSSFTLYARWKKLLTPPAITVSSLADGTVGKAYEMTMTASGDTPFTWNASGLPAGLTLDPATGVISGTPTASGTSSVTFNVNNGAAGLDVVTLFLTIRPASVSATPLIMEDHISYVGGYADGTFQPDGGITRAEVATLFYRLLTDTGSGTLKFFSDVPSDAWYSQASETLGGLELLTGYPDGTFRPNSSITRAEFVTIAARLWPQDSGAVTFSDVSPDFWAYDAIQSAAAKGWLSGYPDGTFRPDSSITRAEAVKILNRMLSRSGDAAYIDNPMNGVSGFSDLPADHWAFYDIMEAAHGHDYTKNLIGAETWTALK